MKVVVLMGGISAERPVSLSSGAQCAAALRQAGHDVTAIDVSRDLSALLAALTPRPDAVFNALHGRYGEDGCIQGVLEWLGIPYTHSGVRASALAMDKAAAKAAFAAAGLPVETHRIIAPADMTRGDPIARPYVLKPVDEGSSVGVTIVRVGDNRPCHLAAEWTFGDRIMVEPYVAGRELTVAVMGEGEAAHALTVTEIATDHRFYDFSAKYEEGGSQHTLPARVHPEIAARAMQVALDAHRALSCRGVSRADFRYDDTQGEPGRLVLLEVNTQPGMTPTSLVPEQAAYRGMSFPQLCAWLVEQARCGA
jgi:D-alanine-D-alanine ligase